MHLITKGFNYLSVGLAYYTSSSSAGRAKT